MLVFAHSTKLNKYAQSAQGMSIQFAFSSNLQTIIPATGHYVGEMAEKKKLSWKGWGVCTHDIVRPLWLKNWQRELTGRQHPNDYSELLRVSAFLLRFYDVPRRGARCGLITGSRTHCLGWTIFWTARRTLYNEKFPCRCLQSTRLHRSNKLACKRRNEIVAF